MFILKYNFIYIPNNNLHISKFQILIAIGRIYKWYFKFHNLA